MSFNLTFDRCYTPCASEKYPSHWQRRVSYTNNNAIIDESTIALFFTY